MSVTSKQILEARSDIASSRRAALHARPIVPGRKGEYCKELAQAAAARLSAGKIDGKMLKLDEVRPFNKNLRFARLAPKRDFANTVGRPHRHSPSRIRRMIQWTRPWTSR